MRNPGSAFLCTFLVVFGYGACAYLEHRPELLKVYHKYLTSHPQKFIPVGEVLYNIDLNATIEYSGVFSGIYSTGEQFAYERLNPEVEKWSITQTTATVGKDETGTVHMASVVHYYDNMYIRQNGYCYTTYGNGIFYTQGEEGYEEAAVVIITGSGHGVYTEENITRIAYEVYQVFDNGDDSETTLTYGDIISNATEDRLIAKFLETSKDLVEGKDDVLPVEVDAIESDEPLDWEGDMSLTVNGKVFTEGDDVTFTFDGEGKQWNTHSPSGEPYPKKALRHAVRSAISRLLLKKCKGKRR